MLEIKSTPNGRTMVLKEIPRQCLCPCSNRRNEATKFQPKQLNTCAMTEVTGYNATNDVAQVLHMLVMDTPQNS